MKSHTLSYVTYLFVILFVTNVESNEYRNKSNNPTLTASFFVGNAKNKRPNYIADTSLDALVKYKPLNAEFNLEAGVAIFEQPTKNESLSGRISTSGVLLGVSKIFKLENNFALNIGAHIFNYENKVSFMGRAVGEDTGTTLSIHSTANVYLKNFNVGVGIRRYADIGGAPIQVYYIELAKGIY